MDETSLIDECLTHFHLVRTRLVEVRKKEAIYREAAKPSTSTYSRLRPTSKRLEHARTNADAASAEIAAMEKEWEYSDVFMNLDTIQSEGGPESRKVVVVSSLDHDRTADILCKFYDKVVKDKSPLPYMTTPETKASVEDLSDFRTPLMDVYVVHAPLAPGEVILSTKMRNAHHEIVEVRARTFAEKQKLWEYVIDVPKLFSFHSHVVVHTSNISSGRVVCFAFPGYHMERESRAVLEKYIRTHETRADMYVDVSKEGEDMHQLFRSDAIFTKPYTRPDNSMLTVKVQNPRFPGFLRFYVRFFPKPLTGTKKEMQLAQLAIDERLDALTDPTNEDYLDGQPDPVRDSSKLSVYDEFESAFTFNLVAGHHGIRGDVGFDTLFRIMCEPFTVENRKVSPAVYPFWVSVTDSKFHDKKGTAKWIQTYRGHDKRSKRQ